MDYDSTHSFNAYSQNFAESYGTNIKLQSRWLLYILSLAPKQANI